MFRVLVILSFSLCSFSSAKAGLDTSTYYHFDLKNGLPSNNVYSVLKDRNGYMWFATDNGLVKYNGYTFELYNTESGGLPANDIYDWYEDNRGRLWLMTFGNKFGYIQNGKYKNINFSTKDARLMPQYLSEYKGLFYFSLLLTDGSYNLVVVDDDVIGTFNFSNKIFSPQRNDSIYNISHSDSFNIIVWTAANKLYTWQLGNSERKPEYVSKFPDDFRYVYTHRLVFSKDGFCYMFKPHGNDFLIFNTRSQFFKRVRLTDLGGDSTERIHTAIYFFVKNTPSDHTAIMSNTHLYLVDPDFKLLSRKKMSDVIPSNSQIASRITDRDLGDTWYSTTKDGVWVKPAFYDFYATTVKHSSLDKTTFIGSINNTTFWWDEMKREIYEVVGSAIINSIRINKNVNLKSITGNDTIAYIAATDGLYEYDRRNGKLTSVDDLYQISGDFFGFKDDNKKRADDVALSSFRIIKLVDNTLYAISVSGLIRMPLAGGKMPARRHDRERYSDFFHDKKSNRLYCYSNRRILIHDIGSNTYKIIDAETLEKLGIKNVRQMTKDDFGNVFILDNNSLNIYDEQTGRIRKVNNQFSFVDALMDLKAGRLYIASKSGIATSYILGKDKLSDFSILPNAGMNHYSRIGKFLVCDNGYMVMQTDAKWWSFTTESLKKYSSGLQNGFFSIAVVKPVEKAIINNDSLKVKQNESTLKLGVINYYGKGNVRFSYQVGEGHEWEESSSGEIYLSSLEADQYHIIRLKVKDDLWESKPYTFYIYRYPYWWQTHTWRIIFWITGIVLFLVLVLLTVLITRYFVAKKNERRRALTDLELQAIHSQINPHFIFNTLSAALFYINKRRFDDAYTHVNKFSQLLRSYLKSSHDRYVILDEEIKMLKNYIELQQIRFEEKFEYRIEVDNKLPINNIRIPSLLLQPLVENAINHGLFHRESGGILLLKFEQGADHTELVCTIEDNGVGREAAKKINESTSNKESYGTTLTNQLLDVFKQYEKLDIKMSYADKDLPETGTVVTLTLKNIKYVA